MYDCRKRSWYIETATCSKDIVILLDNSGSMTGFRNYIAQLTVKSVLDTFSNNDFINIYNYSETVRELVPCFNVRPCIFFIVKFSYNLLLIPEHPSPSDPRKHQCLQRSRAPSQARRLRQCFRCFCRSFRFTRAIS